MAYTKYTSIESFTCQQFYDRVADFVSLLPRANDVEWIALEKVHGSNFCFLVSQGGELVQCGKRSSIIEEGPFFNYELILEVMLISLINVFRYL